jgi:hypothetical protein
LLSFDWSRVESCPGPGESGGEEELTLACQQNLATLHQALSSGLASSYNYTLLWVAKFCMLKVILRIPNTVQWETKFFMLISALFKMLLIFLGHRLVHGEVLSGFQSSINYSIFLA